MQDEQHEIEKKFFWYPALAQQLLTHPDAKKKSFLDTYYDTTNHELTKNDVWLRKRANSWQLKIPSTLSAQAQAYQEIDSPREISEYLGLPTITHEALNNANIHPFITLDNKRVSYNERGLTINLDSVRSGSKYLRIGEIEKIVQTPEQSRQAVQEIEAYANKQGIELLPHEPKKVGVFLKAEHRGHYDQLIQANVLDEEAYKNNHLREIGNY